MNRFSILHTAIVGLFIAAGSASHAHGNVRNTTWSFDTMAGERDLEHLLTNNTDDMPFAANATAVQGRSTAVSDYRVESLRGALEFNFEFNHMPGNVRGSAMSMGYIDFIIEAPSPFAIGGWYELTSVGTGELAVSLTRLGESESVIFANEQVARYEPDATLEIGETSGDVSNSLSGTPVGVLSPGSYRLEYSYTRKHDLLDYPPGTGRGELQFLIAPEPASIGLMLVAGLALLRRRSAN